ncbi:MAG TPA: preprotein translocase subunit TatC, partial [Nitrososphaeria archaeon]|nr:preprotein translocase subunit TatC [Nitrososphaeria archaeon]
MAGEKSEKPRNMKEMTLLEHLIELRDRAKVCLITIGVLTLLMLVFPAQLTSPEELLYMYKPLVSLILDWINSMVRPEALELFAGTITAPLEVYFIAALIFALIFSSPVVGYEIFKYVDPALYPHERRMIYPFLAAFLGLFAAGLGFGLYIIAPFTFKAMLIFFPYTGVTFSGISIMDFYTTILIVTLATGIVFTTPVILVLLVRVGLI